MTKFSLNCLSEKSNSIGYPAIIFILLTHVLHLDRYNKNKPFQFELRRTLLLKAMCRLNNYPPPNSSHLNKTHFNPLNNTTHTGNSLR